MPGFERPDDLFANLEAAHAKVHEVRVAIEESSQALDTARRAVYDWLGQTAVRARDLLIERQVSPDMLIETPAKRHRLAKALPKPTLLLEGWQLTHVIDDKSGRFPYTYSQLKLRRMHDIAYVVHLHNILSTDGKLYTYKQKEAVNSAEHLPELEEKPRISRIGPVNGIDINKMKMITDGLLNLITLPEISEPTI